MMLANRLILTYPSLVGPYYLHELWYFLMFCKSAFLP